MNLLYEELKKKLLSMRLNTKDHSQRELMKDTKDHSLLNLMN